MGREQVASEQSFSNTANSPVFYKAPNDEAGLQDANKLKNLIEKFITHSPDYGNGTTVEFSVSYVAILNIFRRIDKREEYFRFFHKIEMSEKKYAALLAYWIIKFRPIRITEPRFVDDYIAEEVNERFAVFMIYSIVFELKEYSVDDLNTLFEKMEHAEELAEYKQYSYQSKLIYAFRYRAVSLDAMLTIVEGLTDDSFALAFEEKP